MATVAASLLSPSLARSTVVRPSRRSACAARADAQAQAHPQLLLRRAAVAAALAATLLQSAPALASKPRVLEPQPTLVATLRPTRGNEGVSGRVTIGESVNARGRSYVNVQVELRGLTPGPHGLNIHELGGASCDDGLCVGASYNPEGLPHGAPGAVKKFGASASHYLGEGSRAWRHAGDLGNVTADGSGSVNASFEEPVVQLSGPYSVVGRSVVVHAQADDYVTEPQAVVAYGTLQVQP